MSPEERFDYAVKLVLEHEGGYSDNDKDPGGPTKYGVSLRFLKEQGFDVNHDGKYDNADIKDIYFTDAIDIYKAFFWKKYRYDEIKSLKIATKLFDMAVSIGPGKTNRIAQKAVNYLNQDEAIVVDGVMGLNTLQAINVLSPTSVEYLLHLIKTYLNDFYDALILENPELQTFSKGWHRRADWLPTISS